SEAQNLPYDVRDSRAAFEAEQAEEVDRASRHVAIVAVGLRRGCSQFEAELLPGSRKTILWGRCHPAPANIAAWPRSRLPVAEIFRRPPPGGPAIERKEDQRATGRPPNVRSLTFGSLGGGDRAASRHPQSLSDRSLSPRCSACPCRGKACRAIAGDRARTRS